MSNSSKDIKSKVSKRSHMTNYHLHLLDNSYFLGNSYTIFTLFKLRHSSLLYGEIMGKLEFLDCILFILNVLPKHWIGNPNPRTESDPVDVLVESLCPGLIAFI